MCNRGTIGEAIGVLRYVEQSRWLGLLCWLGWMTRYSVQISGITDKTQQASRWCDRILTLECVSLDSPGGGVRAEDVEVDEVGMVFLMSTRGYQPRLPPLACR